jgi:hypothetical protein
MNIDKDFTFQTIKLAPDLKERSYVNFFKSQPRRQGVYLHGYNDYFFHTAAEKFNENNFDFYALDLENGSLLKISNYCKDIEEYFEEISIAIRNEINTISKKLIWAFYWRINSK